MFSDGARSTMTSESLVVPYSRVRSPDPAIAVTSANAPGALAATPMAPPPPTEEMIRQMRSQDIFKPPSPPENH
jgi:hypothetical protein